MKVFISRATPRSAPALNSTPGAGNQAAGDNEAVLSIT
jgi:hypothetical protein